MPERPHGAERFLRPFVEDPSLRIVLIAGVGIVVTFGAWLAANAIRAGSASAIAALLLLAVMSAEAVRSELVRRRRPGPLAVVIGAVWGLTALVTWAALRSGLL